MTGLTRDLAEQRLRAFDRRTAAQGSGRGSAVAVTLFAGPDGVATHTVITKRTTTLSAHKGQWAFPGGREDEGETSAAAAVRELAEELGLDLGPEAVLGALDDLNSRSGFRITPVVLWTDASPDGLVGNPDEVASVHPVPLDELDVDPVFLDDPDQPTPVLRFPFRDRFIHPPTGAILFQLRELLLHGRPTRVHTFSTLRRLER